MTLIGCDRNLTLTVSTNAQIIFLRYLYVRNLPDRFWNKKLTLIVFISTLTVHVI